MAEAKIFNHERNPNNTKDEWLTPPPILSALGPFDLDPCAPVNRPWDMARRHYTILDDGLLLPWEGRSWCNPPYGKKAAPFMARMAEHNNGIALLFARTETQLFFGLGKVWESCSALLFIEGRLTFYNVDGTPARDKDGKESSAGAPSVLIAYGQANAEALLHSEIAGIYIPRRDWVRLPQRRVQPALF